MRTKKAEINFIVNLSMLFAGFLPLFFLRKVFLDTLGNDFLGLAALYTSLIGLLSLAELGISSAIIYALYKPYAENDVEKVMGYIRYYAKFYQVIGLAIFIAGLAIMPFFPLIIKGDIPIADARIYFLLVLASTVSTYFFTAKTSLLIVAQEGYRITVFYTASILLTAGLQILALNVYGSFFLYLAIQLAVNFLYFFAINAYIRKRFEWSKGTHGTIGKKEKQEVAKNTKALFIHKIGEFSVFGTDNLLISYFINTATVGVYHSYYLVIAVGIRIIGSAFNSLTASIGNLLIGGEEKKIYGIHQKLFFFNFWIVSFFVISLFNTLQQFVLLWLGESQFLDKLTLSIILLNLYITLMRFSIEKFKEAGGLYQQDQYTAILEAVINLGFSILLVHYMGLAGIFLGTLISNLAVVFWVKPKIVYRHIFRVKLRAYFAQYFQYAAVALAALGLTYLATRVLQETIALPAFIWNCLLNFLLINLFYYIVFRKNEEFLYFKKLISNRLSGWLSRGQAD